MLVHLAGKKIFDIVNLKIMLAILIPHEKVSLYQMHSYVENVIALKKTHDTVL